MTLQAIEKNESIENLPVMRLLRRAARIFTFERHVTGSLDLEVTSDHIKRDLGFLDGREPLQECDLTR